MRLGQGFRVKEQIPVLDGKEKQEPVDQAEKFLAQCPSRFRQWEWHYLKRRCNVRWLRLVGHTDQVRSVAYSIDGKRVASCGNDGTVRVWDTET
jgi:WD40 repeat protein